MKSSSNHELDEFRYLANQYPVFQATVLAYQEWLNEDTNVSFNELLRGAVESSKEDFAKKLALISKEEKTSFITSLKAIGFDKTRGFGKEIDDVLKGVEGTRSPYDYKIRNLCMSVGGHLNDLFEASEKNNDHAVQTKLKLLHWIGNEHKGGGKLFDLFAELVSDIRRLLSTEESSELESDLAFATRCIETHAGKKAAKIIANNNLLQHQLNTIVWKHYVKGNGKVGRKTLPALDHLIELRNKNRNVIQIIGEGGLGKTKLTIEFMKHCLESDELRFESVLMLTAKSPEQGEWNTSFSSFRNQEGLLSPRDPTLAFGHYVQDMDYDKVMDYIYDLVDVEKHREDRLLEELRKGNHLIILDNFEDASQSVAERFYDDFFDKVDELAECQSKIIITGRTAHEDASKFRMLELLRLSDSQALELMKLKYDFEFRQYYSGQTSGNRVQIFDDFKKAINEKLIPNIKKTIEGIDPDIASNFMDGVLHPGVLFYFISMLMDGDLYDDYVREKEISPSFAALFEYAVCHQDYGIPAYLDRWDDWIKDKTTKYIQNDKSCMAILAYMAEHPTEFFDVISLLDALPDLDKPTLSTAFTKLASHDGILEKHLENGKQRISSSTISRFGLKDKASLSADLITELRPIFENSEALSRQLPLSIPDGKQGSSLSLNDFGLLVECTHRILDAGKIHTFEKCVKKLNILFNEIYGRVLPIKSWTIPKLATFANTQSSESIAESKYNKEEWVKKATDVFVSDDFDVSKLPDETKDDVQKLPMYFVNFLSLSQTLSELTTHLDTYKVPLLHGFSLPMRFSRMLERVAADETVPSEAKSLVQLFTLMEENFEQIKTPTVKFLEHLHVFGNFDSEQGFEQQLRRHGLHFKDLELTKKAISESLERPDVKWKLKVTPSSIKMMELFNCLSERINVEYGVEADLESALPFTELKFSQDYPSLESAIEGNAEFSYIGADGKKSGGFEPQKRCFIVSSIPFLKSYTLIQVFDAHPTSKKTEAPTLAEKTETSSQDPIDFTDIAVEFIIGLQFLQRYINELAQTLAEANEEAPESGWLEFLTTQLAGLVDKVNEDERTKNKWDIMYSLTGKVPIGINRKPSESPKSVGKNNAVRSHYIDFEVKAWFERNKQGVYSDFEQAKRTLDELFRELVPFHSIHHQQTVSPVDFANKFIGKFSRPYSDHRRTSMRFYAAFGASRTQVEPTISAVIDDYEREFRRQLEMEKIPNTKKEKIFRFCEDWLRRLRESYDLPVDSYIKRKRERDQERDRARNLQRQQERANREQKRKKERIKREEMERIEEEKRAESARRQRVMEFTDVMKQRPFKMAPKVYFVEFYDALCRLSAYSSVTNDWSTIETTISKIIAGCYDIVVCHAKLYVYENYKKILVELERILDEHGIKGIPQQEQEPRLWPLVTELFKHIGFLEEEILPLQNLLHN